MTLIEQIIEKCSTVTRDDFLPNGLIRLRDKGDGIVFIDKWEHPEVMPSNFKLGITEEEARLLLGGN